MAYAYEQYSFQPRYEYHPRFQYQPSYDPQPTEEELLIQRLGTVLQGELERMERMSKRDEMILEELGSIKKRLEEYNVKAKALKKRIDYYYPSLIEEECFEVDKRDEQLWKEIENLKGAMATCEAGQKILETQLAQQASSSSRPQGVLPAHSKANLRWEANYLGITEEEEEEFLKGNIWLDDDENVSPMIYDEEVKAMELKSGKRYETPRHVPLPKKNFVEPPKVVKEHVQEEVLTKEKDEVPKKDKKLNIPYPSRLKGSKSEDKEKDKDKGFKKFVEMMKGLYVTLPLAEILTHAPHYKRYLKEVATKKKSLEEEPKVVVLNE